LPVIRELVELDELYPSDDSDDDADDPLTDWLENELSDEELEDEELELLTLEALDEDELWLEDGLDSEVQLSQVLSVLELDPESGLGR
jgi:hypothetical protein